MRFSHLLYRRDFRMALLDIFMMFLVMINLGYIIFEYNFEVKLIRELIQSISPTFHDWYAGTLHKNFFYYDLIFVAIFLAELLGRWALAIHRKTYEKWFFYPFAHWYDVLGCIPLSAFRALRFLRVISLTIRLHKLKVINIREFYIYRVIMKYVGVFTEEVSDRVVLNVLDGVQEQIEVGNPVVERIVKEVVLPQKTVLVDWISHRLQHITDHAYKSYEPEIKEYVRECILEATADNRELKALKLVPVVGPLSAGAIEHAIHDITFNVINSIVRDLASDNNRDLVQDITDMSIDAMLDVENDKVLDGLVKGMANSSIDIIKEQVAIKQWKVKEELEKEMAK